MDWIRIRELSQQPFQTISNAARKLRPGDVCWIRSGLYRETVKLTSSGQEKQPITFVRYQDEHVIVMLYQFQPHLPKRRNSPADFAPPRFKWVNQIRDTKISNVFDAGFVATTLASRVILPTFWLDRA